MRSIRRWAGLCNKSLAVLVAAVALLLMTGASASAAPGAPAASAASAVSATHQAPAASTTPVQMNYACTSKSTGLMRYVSSTTQCTKAEKAVTIVPGPEYVCIYFNFFVRQVAAAKDCPSSSYLKEVTLPPASGSVYFCALKAGGLLTYTTKPSSCNSRLQFPVVVSHQPPVISGVETTPLSYQAGTAPVAITSTLTVSDVDDSTLSGATVSITSGFDSGADTLGFTNANGITGSYDASTGVLTLSGSASVADYQAALRSVTFSTSDTSASPAARTVTFQVTDSAGAKSNTESRTIDVTAAAHPVLSNIETTPLSYQSQTSPVAITSTLTVSDAGDATLSGATVSITSGFDSGADTLGFTNANGITGSYDASTGVLTLSGSASLADYQAALRSVTFSTTDTSASPAARTVTFQVTDSEGVASNTESRTIDVTEAAQPPVISNVETTPLSYQSQTPPVAITSTLTLADPGDSTIAGATVSITSGFDSGADTLGFTNTATITGSYDASTGVLTLAGDDTVANYQAALRSVTFSTSDSSASPAARTVSFQVTDTDSQTSNTESRTIDVSPAAQPPTAQNQSYTAVGNTTLAVGTTPTGPAVTYPSGQGLLNGDTGDSYCGSLSVTGNTTPSHGTVTVNPDGTFTYLPSAGYSGTDTFQYTITCSGSGKSATGNVSIAVGTVVWYVDDSQSAAGNGESGTPFNTLAAANSAAGANSIIFLYTGNATYTGGVTLHSGDDLWGQPHGLTVGSYNLVAAGGSNPTITNSGGDGIDLASNVDIEDVNVSGASAYGIDGSGVTGTVTIANCTITGSTIDNGFITDTSGSLDLTVTGSTFNNDDATGDNDEGLDVNANGSTSATVSVTGSTFTNDNGLSFDFETDAAASGTDSVTFSDNSISSNITDNGAGVEITPSGTTHSTVTVDDNNIQGVVNANGIGIDAGIQPTSDATLTGTVSGNTVGSPTVSGSGGGNSIGIYAEGSSTETLAVTNNKLYQYDNFAGIYYIDREGSPTLNLTITGNTIADPDNAQGGAWGIYGEGGAESTDSGTVCADITGNSITGSGTGITDGEPDFELDQTGSTVYELPGYTGASTDTNAVVNFVAGNNNSGGTPSGIATVNGGGFSNTPGGSACPTP